MTVSESLIIVAVLMLLFFVLLINFWGVFDLVFDQIRCQYIATSYFKVLYNEGALTPEKQGALAAELAARGVTVNSLQIEEAAEWGDPVSLTIIGTIELSTRGLNGASSLRMVPFRFERHSLASSLREAMGP